MSDLTDESCRRVGIAETIAESWNRAGICHAVAHGLGNYPVGPFGRDLDVFMESGQQQRALDIVANTCRENGWSLCVHRKPWVWQTFALAASGESPLAVEIDYIIRFHWGPRVLFDCPDVRSHIGPFGVDPWAAFAKRILIQVLGGESDKFRRKPQELLVTELERCQVSRRLPEFVGDPLTRELLCAVDNGDVEHLRRLAPRLRRELVLRALAQNPLKLLRICLNWIRFELELLFPRPCAPIIAVVGPDGIGKSTVIAKAASLIREHLPFTDVVVRHWRPGLLPSLARVAGQPPSPLGTPIPPRRSAGKFHLARLAYYLLDFLVGFWWKDLRSSAVLKMLLYDRCALDMAVDPLRYGLSSARGTRLLWTLIPKPDLVILLYDTPERIVTRKAELDVDEVGRQLKAWLRLTEEGHVDAVIRVDAEPAEIARRIQDLLADGFIRMNGGDLCAKLRDEVAVSTLRAIVSGRPFSTFAIVPSQRRPRFLIPLAPRRAAASLRVYAPQKPLARMARHLLSIGLRTRLAQAFLPTNPTFSAPDPLPPDGQVGRSLQEHLGDVLGEKNLTMAVSLRTPGLHRKVVLQLMNSRGKILANAKVGWNEQTIPLVRNEETLLRRLAGLRFSTAVVPAVLYAGWWDGRYILMEDAPAGPTKPSGHELSRRHLEFLRELRTANPKQSRPVENGPANELAQRIATLRARGLHYYPHLLEQAVARCVERLMDVPISFGFKHGDFTPWNILDESGKLFIFDWEYAEQSALPGWDLFHFIVQTSVLVKGLDGRRCLQAVRRQSAAPGGLAEFLTPASATQQLLGPLFFLYIADIMSWYLLRDAEASDEKGQKPRDAWTYLLTMAAFAHSPFSWTEA